MRWCFIFIILLALARISPVHAAGDEQYVEIYLLIQEADQMLASAQQPSAKEKYLEALAKLTVLQKLSPDWNPKAVQFRLGYVNEKIATLKDVRLASEKPAVEIPGKTPTPTVDPTVPFKETIARLETEKNNLMAKLQEALSPQPAAADPRELGKAEEKIKGLEKAKDLAEANLKQALEKLEKTVDRSIFEVSQANTARLEQDLKTRDTAALKLGQELSELKLALEKAKVNSDEPRGLKEARAKIESQLALLAKEKEKLEGLKSENEILKRRAAELAAAQQGKPTVGSEKSKDKARVKSLEKERDELENRLKEANKLIQTAKSKGSNFQSGNMSNQVSILRARLETFEARKVPYTAEELALFKTSPLELSKGSLSASDNSKSKGGREKGRRNLASGAVSLVVEAERAFAAGQFDVAEQKYLEVLKLDVKNTYVLANIATINLQQNRLPQAEDHLNSALGEDPTDAYAQSLMGILRIRQDKFDEALDFLSKASIANPNDAETQNYLAVTLSHKGQRIPAETAFRRAIQLNPNYAKAHYNLAMAYMSSQPPALELARYHYQKSQALGQPPNAAVEKTLNGK